MAAAPHHGLRAGVEVDYNVANHYWTPARVESIQGMSGEESVHIRFVVGSAHVTHILRLSCPAHRRRLAAIGMKSCPLVDGQPMDYLRQQNPAGALEAAQQWQRCEVVTHHAGLRAAGFPREGVSYGGCQAVALKIVSTGSKVLGVTYAVTAEHINDDPYVRKGEVERLPMDVRVGNALGREHVLAATELLAVGGTFGKWVPTTADVENISDKDLDPRLIFLSRRARAFFAGSAEITARYNLGGRGALVDFDVIDILPRGRRMPYRENKPADQAIIDALAPFHTRCAEDGSATSIGFQMHLHAPPSSAEKKKPPQQWYLGRVKWEASGGHPSSPPLPYVYWFEPALEWRDSEPVLKQCLRRACLHELRAIAPAGTHSLPYVYGMQVETRHFGGSWKLTTVVSASPWVLRISVPRPPKEEGLKVVAASRAFRSTTSSADEARKVDSTEDSFDINSYIRDTHLGTMANVRTHAGSVTSIAEQQRERSILDAIGVADEGFTEGPVERVEADFVESVYHHAWRFTVARAGHFCAPDEPVVKSVPRKGTLFFRSGEAAARKTSAVAAAAESALHGLNSELSALPAHAADRVRRRTLVDGLFSRS